MESQAERIQDGEVFVHDIGGHPLEGGGQVRRGLLYRFSGALLTDLDWETMAQARLRLVVDLRGRDEDRAALKRWAGAHLVDYHHEPIEVGRPELLAAWGSGMAPDDATGQLGGLYRHVIDDHGPRLAAAVGLMSRNLPAAFGCAAGKDRTGVLAAMVLGLLGVESGDIARHYAAAPPPPDRLAPLARRWKPNAGALSPGTRAMLGAPPGIMLATLAYVTERYGGIGACLEHFGLERARADALRQALIATE